MKIDELLEHVEEKNPEQLDENLLALAASGAASYFGVLWLGSKILGMLGLAGASGLVVTPLVGIAAVGAVGAGGFYGVTKGIDWIRGSEPSTRLGAALKTVTDRWKKERSDPNVNKVMRLYADIEKAIVERDEIIAESANVPEEDREYYFMSRRADIAKASRKMVSSAIELEDLLLKVGEESLGKSKVEDMEREELEFNFRNSDDVKGRNRKTKLETGAASLGIFKEEYSQMMGWIHAAQRGELTAIRP